MSFTSKTNTSATTTTTQQKKLIEPQLFNNIIEDIQKYWKKFIKENEDINEDIKNLERMFNVYNNNEIFYQAKEILLEHKHYSQQKMLELESQVYEVHKNFVNIS